MPLPTRICLSAAVCAGLAACGGAGNPLDFDGPAPIGPITSDAAALMDRQFEAQSAAIAAIDPTPIGTVPDTGTAVFTGMSQVVVTPGSGAAPMTLTGDTAMKIDFGDPLITAEMNNFTGADASGGNLRLDGAFRMDNGRLNTVTENSFVGSFRGILTGAGMEVQASGGAFTGTFRGAPTASASFSGLDETGLYNGAPARISLSGVAAE